MKKLASIGLVAIYFVLSVGVNVLIHTCGGYRSVDVLPISTEDPCGCCDEFSDDMCCTLVLHTFHIGDDQQVAPNVTVASPDCVIVEYASDDEHYCGAALSSLPSIAESPSPQVSATILNCVFLI